MFASAYQQLLQYCLNYYHLKSYEIMHLNKKQKMLKSKLNGEGPTVEPQGTPDIIFYKLFLLLFNRAHYFLLSKY